MVDPSAEHTSAPSAATQVPHPGGLVLQPFRALRYRTPEVGSLEQLTAPPYDVIDDAERSALEALHPANVVHLILPRPEPADAESAYRRAAELLGAWRSEQILELDAAPSLYVYETSHDGHVQRGLVGALGLCDPDWGIVLPHENTMAGPVSDRYALTVATQANLEPIFLMYRGGTGPTSQLLRSVDALPPLAQCAASDGVLHRLWAVTDSAVLADVAQDLWGRTAVIADGHHRYATYLAYQRARHEAADGAGPWDFGLTLLVDVALFGPEVHAIHRVLPTLSYTEAVRRASSGWQVAELDASDLPWPGSTGSTRTGSEQGRGVPSALAALAEAGQTGPAFVVAGEGRCALISSPDPEIVAEAMPADASSAWRRLDVAVAHRVLIRSTFGLEDDEATVGYRHDVASALVGADSSGGAALLLNPTPATDVIEVATRGERMPRKSTLFTPKPLSGMLIRPLDVAAGP